jgi:hypothetical protein
MFNKFKKKIYMPVPESLSHVYDSEVLCGARNGHADFASSLPIK